MSYLDLPRLSFGGLFQASPSTFNNTPNNYDPQYWAQGSDPDQPTDQIELYWGPQGDGIFDLVECSVKSAITAWPSAGDPPGCRSGDDALLGQPVSAVYTKAPPKLVDLDPMQQNVSELWGLVLQIGAPGGPNVMGTFAPIAFNGIWANSQGKDTPRNSQSGSGVYQSTLTNLRWNVGDSSILAALQQQSPRKLSVRMVVRSHNNKPQSYWFNEATLQKIPAEVRPQLEVLTTWRQMGGPGTQCPGDDKDGTPCGLIPTASYVNFQLQKLLGEQLANEYGPEILKATEQPYVTEPYMGLPVRPYSDIIKTEFNHGLLTGSVGPASDDDPTYVVPARTLAPSKDSPCWFAPALLHASNQTLTLDLGNSLPVELPYEPPWIEKLGESLSVGYVSDDQGTIVPICDVQPSADLIDACSGVVDVPVATAAQVEALQTHPLVIQGTPGGQPATLLEESSEGLFVRADQFVFRMNPGLQGPRGGTAEAQVYVRKFGQVAGTDNLQVLLELLSESEAIKYTLGTLGTSGSKGIENANLSVPRDALRFSSKAAAVENGIARFTFGADNPLLQGKPPRPYVDGQIYFVTYTLLETSAGSEKTVAAAPFQGDPNDLLSFQIYNQTEVGNPPCPPLRIGDPPTWDTGIREILTQYGQLYPIMANIGLSDHATVQQNAAMILEVLQLEMADPLQMPVTRDLSASRRKIIVDWLEAGAQ